MNEIQIGTTHSCYIVPICKVSFIVYKTSLVIIFFLRFLNKKLCSYSRYLLYLCVSKEKKYKFVLS